MTAPAALDERKVAAFEERPIATFNAGALCLMTSVGHRVGLFDAMAAGPPGTSAEVATAAGLDERYVREWLGAMVAAGVVEHDPDAGTYGLPAEHAARLTRAAAPANLAVIAQFVPLLGGVEDDIAACFRDDGGVPYARFGRFHEVMAEESGQTILPALSEHVLPLVPSLVGRLEAGIRVLDAGCGRGRALNLLAGLFPASRLVGYDLSEDAVGFARAEAAREGRGNVGFEVRDLSRFDETAEPGAFDLVTTFDAVHDQARPPAMPRGLRRSLAADGVYLAQDIKGTIRHHLDREPVRHAAPHDLLHALPDGVAGPGRGGAGRHVGAGDGRALLPRGRLRLGRGPRAGARPAEPLLRLPALSGPGEAGNDG